MSHGRTKTKIKEVFRQLVRESTFAKVKVADIIERAGVSRMTFYRHYPDKYALLEELCFDDFNLFVQIYGPNATWKQITMSILNMIANNGTFYQKILEDKEASPFLFQAQHRISQQYTGKIAVQGTNTAWEGTICNWAKDGFRETAEEIYRTLVYNLPIREVLPEKELERAIKGYENKTMEEFMLQQDKRNS